ncbi:MULTISPECIES: ABC transporter permease [Parachlamydia]|jgi:ABC-2 type transport system permease protein|uniref:ABC-2 type transport system permease protein n=2 Tax=Parachlamydia acanthamoebae TaxID=83552 RepID=F8L199_PARAV|nr:ABC-2 family transporter protein [Parachlamydia acanthamoebae]EFB40644.1 hypothetical protein pah_c197o019 [Parachlamydia acanthamoebae str. Hall's coccus]CCB87026.1 putative uncharacterized protein [Parachlamydia acanthamoebae UV-7]
MSVFKTMVFMFYLLKTSIQASLSNKNAFLLESVLMILNNFIFFSLWWIFFNQFHDIDGWKIEEMILLSAIGSGAYGLMQVLFGGIKLLSKMIINGDLDFFMLQPKNLLIHISSSRSLAKGWGHLFTMILFMIYGGLQRDSICLIVISSISGCMVFVSIGIIAHSLPFWMGSVETLSKKYFDSVYLFALYPTNIYSGFMQLVMYTVIPAGIIGNLPVSLIRDFSWIKLALLMGSSSIFLLGAFCVFHMGLKHYESGNKFGLRI